MPDRLPPHRHGLPASPAPLGPRFRRSLRRFALAGLALLLVGLVAGVVFGRSDPPRAARLVVGQFTVEEDHDAAEPGPDEQLPTSGPDRGLARCGVTEVPVPPDEQVEVLAAGVVIVQHATDLDDVGRAALAELGTRDRVLVAPNPALDDRDTPVVATAWRHRMALQELDGDLLDAFVTGHADRSPAPEPCPRPTP